MWATGRLASKGDGVDGVVINSMVARFSREPILEELTVASFKGA